MSNPCVKCGSLERYSNGDCKACARRRALEYQKTHKETVNPRKRRWARKWREEHIEEARQIERNRRPRYKAKNKEGMKRFKKSNPNYWKVWGLNYRANNHEEVLTAQRIWRKNNPEKSKASTAKWREEHPESLKSYTQNRKAYKRASEGIHSGLQRLGRFNVYGGMCWICLCKPAEHMDHVFALCNGGSNWASNLRPACAKCNGAKGNWEMSEKKSLQQILDWVAHRRSKTCKLSAGITGWHGRQRGEGSHD